jgi:trehalose 6-phosphate synthase
MNIVAKEYCASKQDKNGVVILSEYAGTVAQFQRNALVVNPYDIEGVTEAIHLAVTMPKNEMHVRMRKLRQSVKKSDVYWWVNSFLLAGIAKRLDNFPIIEDFVPQDRNVKLQVKSVSV